MEEGAAGPEDHHFQMSGHRIQEGTSGVSDRVGYSQENTGSYNKI